MNSHLGSSTNQPESLAEMFLELARDIAGELKDEDYHAQCDVCGGSGRANDIAGTPIQCPDCDGEGWIEL